MPLGWVAGAAALVGAGVSAYDAYQQTGIQDTAEGMATTQFGEQQQYAQLLNNLLANPGSISTTPEYQFDFSQGADAVAREMGASGFLGSGNEAIALTQYGQGYASNAVSQQEQLLAQLSGLQTTSANSGLLNTSSGAGSTAFNQTGQLLASMGYMYGQGSFGSAGTPGGAGMNYGMYGDMTTANMPNISASEYAGALA